MGFKASDDFGFSPSSIRPKATVPKGGGAAHYRLSKNKTKKKRLWPPLPRHKAPLSHTMHAVWWLTVRFEDVAENHSAGDATTMRRSMLG